MTVPTKSAVKQLHQHLNSRSPVGTRRGVGGVTGDPKHTRAALTPAVRAVAVSRELRVRDLVADGDCDPIAVAAAFEWHCCWVGVGLVGIGDGG